MAQVCAREDRLRERGVRQICSAKIGFHEIAAWHVEPMEVRVPQTRQAMRLCLF